MLGMVIPSIARRYSAPSYPLSIACALRSEEVGLCKRRDAGSIVLSRLSRPICGAGRSEHVRVPFTGYPTKGGVLFHSCAGGSCIAGGAKRADRRQWHRQNAEMEGALCAVLLCRPCSHIPDGCLFCSR